MRPIHIIGGGLAGSEAAWQAANCGVPAVLHEMRPARTTAAHRTAHLAELVCSNSFRSDDASTNAVGVLHREMRALGSTVLKSADAHQVPAGSALAVDRDGFSQAVEAALLSHPLITLDRSEIAGLPPEDWDNVIIATGPLTSPALAEAIRALTGEGALAFFDAIAPIVHRHSINMGVAWMQSRYDKGGPGGNAEAYVNCPMSRDQYEAFIDALLKAEKTEFREFEGTPYFDGCLPIEVMAERGRETLRHGPMKPFGLTNAHDPKVKPYAVVQLRQDNALGTLFNMVGFQTKLKYGEQGRIFRMIPGLEGAEFARLGGMHRNTYLNSPRLLDARLRLKRAPRLRFAGQITGCEGYVESAAVGLIAGRFAAASGSEGNSSHRRQRPRSARSSTTSPAATSNRSTPGPRSFQPMNVNFGLFPPIAEPRFDEAGKRLAGPERGIARKRALSARAERDLTLDGQGSRADAVRRGLRAPAEFHAPGFRREIRLHREGERGSVAARGGMDAARLKRRSTPIEIRGRTK